MFQITRITFTGLSNYSMTLTGVSDRKSSIKHYRSQFLLSHSLESLMLNNVVKVTYRWRYASRLHDLTVTRQVDRCPYVCMVYHSLVYIFHIKVSLKSRGLVFTNLFGLIDVHPVKLRINQSVWHRRYPSGCMVQLPPLYIFDITSDHPGHGSAFTGCVWHHSAPKAAWFSLHWQVWQHI